MADREKIMEALTLCANGEPCTGEKYRTCPYSPIGKPEYYNCGAAMAADALALLREQEPRVMTLEEVKAYDWDYCYLEEERLPGKEYRAVCGDYALTCITWPCVTSMRIQHGDEKYGKKWRCWTHKPTDEQRKAVKWDGRPDETGI